MSGWCQQKVTIQTAMSLAQANNPFLKTASYNIDISRSDVTTAGLRLNPVLNNQTLQSMDSKYYIADPRWSNANNRQVWWQFTKRFRLNGQRAYQIETASNVVGVEQKNFQDLRRLVASESASQWLNAWLMKNKLDLFLQAQSNVDSLVKLNEVRLQNLAVTSTDVLRTKILSDQFALQIRTAKNSYGVELKKLKLLLGISDSLELDNQETFRFEMVDSISLDGLFSTGLRLRTDFQAAQAVVKVWESNIKLQRSLAYPTPELGVIWNPQNTIPYLGFFGTLEIPLFARNQGEIQKSAILKSQAEQNINATRQKITNEIQVAYNNYQTEKNNLKGYSDILNQTETVLNTVRYAYLHGGTTLIDFLEAQRTWLETRQLYTEALQMYRIRSIDLLTATGLITQLNEQ